MSEYRIKGGIVTTPTAAEEARDGDLEKEGISSKSMTGDEVRDGVRELARTIATTVMDIGLDGPRLERYIDSELSDYEQRIDRLKVERQQALERARELQAEVVAFVDANVALTSKAEACEIEIAKRLEQMQALVGDKDALTCKLSERCKALDAERQAIHGLQTRYEQRIAALLASLNEANEHVREVSLTRGVELESLRTKAKALRDALEESDEDLSRWGTCTDHPTRVANRKALAGYDGSNDGKGG